MNAISRTYQSRRSLSPLIFSLFNILTAVVLPTSVFANVEGGTNKRTQGNFTSVSDAIWQLTDLTLIPDSALHRNPQLGGQNFTHCCLLAVNASLRIVDGFLIKQSPDYVQTTVDELLAEDSNQFPCTATWNGDAKGASLVSVPAWWLENTCPGWQLSDTRSGDESQWVNPFVGFILSSVIFCLTIPRRRKFAVWKKLFVLDLSQLISWILAPFAMILAGICVCCDTIIWLCMCFAFASPMILSGFYEAYIDQKILGFLTEKTNNFRLTIDMRARLLFVILVGNLDLDPGVIEGDLELTLVDYEDRDDNHTSRWPNYKGDLIRNPSSPWTHIENLVHPLRSYRDSAIGTPRQWPLHDVECPINNCTDPYCKEVPLSRTAYVRKEIGRTKTRLRTMLATQYSFGSSSGAPIVFFLGAFGFTMATTLSSLGDEDTSLDLAFGMWYMIIPHISIVSALLLAGNNPNTLEGVVGLEFGGAEEHESFEKKNFINSIFELAYDSRYKPKWLWMRGLSKRDWVERVWQTYGMRPSYGQRDKLVPDQDMMALRKTVYISVMGWAVVLGLTLLLMGVPFILAFATAFYTPEVGISCRSLTFLVYAIAQLSQIVLWMWAFGGAPASGTYFSFFRQGGWLDLHGFYTPWDKNSLLSKDTFWSLPSLWAFIWYSLTVIFGLGGVVTSIGGTMMQLMGVYNSDICKIDAQWWTKSHPDAMIVISRNYALEIMDAKKYWIPCGITAILFLGLVSFCGWWYQRRLRGLFRKLVCSIGDPMIDREDIKAASIPSPDMSSKS